MNAKQSTVRGLLVSLLAFVVLLCGASPAAAQVYTIAPGSLYTSSHTTARQFSPSLELLASGGPFNPSGSTGAAISADGLFLCEAFRVNIAGLPDGAHFLALGNGGTVVHELFLTNIGLNAASGIGVDSTGTIYAAAANGLHQISANFLTNTVLPIGFGRASGVAVAPNDFLYVTDQVANQIKIINVNRQLVGAIPTGRVPSGATFGPDGYLYYTDTPFQTPDAYIGRLVKVNPLTLQQTILFDDLAFPMDIEFAPDGSYYLAAHTGREIDHYSANNVLLHSFSDGVIMDQLAFYAPVPEPGSFSLVLLAATVGAFRHCRGRSRQLPTV